jgi:hypothetical protein
MGPAIGVETIGEGPAFVLVEGAFGSQAWAPNVGLGERAACIWSRTAADESRPRPEEPFGRVRCIEIDLGLAPLVIDGRR